MHTQLRQCFTGQIKINWTQGQWVAILLDTLKGSEVQVLWSHDSIFKLWFFEDVEFVKKDIVKNFAIEEEYVDIFIGVIGIIKVSFLTLFKAQQIKKMLKNPLYKKLF